MRRAVPITVTLVVLGLIAVAGAYMRDRVRVLHRHQQPRPGDHVPGPALRRFPGTSTLYTAEYVSGVAASTLTAERRHSLLDHTLRSEGDAASLIRSLELGQLE